MSNPIILWDNALRYGADNQPVPSFQALFNDNETIDYGTGPITSTRSSVGYYFDPTTKLLTSAAVDELRFERDPVDGVVRALIEESRTNLALYSEQFDNAAWTKGDLNVSANATGAPDSAVTADLLTEDSATASHYILQGISLSASTAYAVSVFAKQDSGTRYLVIRPTGLGTGQAYAVFDLINGTVFATGGALSPSATILPLVSGWYRCTLRVTFGVGTPTGIQYLLSNDGTENPTYLGDGTSGIYFWGAQVEQAIRQSSYIPTTSSTVTRSADIVSIPNSEIPALSNGCTIEIEAALPDVGGTARAFLASGGGGSTTIYRHSSGVIFGSYGGIVITSATTPSEDVHSYAMRTDGTTHELLIDGVSVGSNTGTLTQPTNALYIGSNSGTSDHVNNLVGGLKIWNRYLTDAEINANSSGYAISTGLEQSGTLLSEAWTWDALRNAILTSDVNGAATANLFIRGATPTHFVFGAHRHDAAGFRVNEGMCYIDAYTASGWTNVGSADLSTNASSLPELIVLSAYTPVTVAGHYQFRMRLTGLTVSSDFVIPELFLGEDLTLPGIRYPFDPETEEWTGPRSVAETGRIYESALSRRYVPAPRIVLADAATAVLINDFRENHIEERSPFWWFYDPTNDPTVGYMMRHDAKTMRLARVDYNHWQLELKMIEAV